MQRCNHTAAFAMLSFRAVALSPRLHCYKNLDMRKLSWKALHCVSFVRAVAADFVVDALPFVQTFDGVSTVVVCVFSIPLIIGAAVWK